MLTDSEREWLNHRNIAHPDGDYFCEHCDVFAECHMYWPIECPTKLSIKPEDIAFEARVAAKLVDLVKYSVRVCHHSCADCFLYKTDKCHDDDPDNLTCEGTILKYARLAVEEEMDGYNTM